MCEARRKTLHSNIRLEPSHVRNNVQSHSRRQTTAGITTEGLRKPVEKPSLRIEKSRDTRKREAPKNENYAEAFQGQLNAYKTNLISALNHNFVETDAILDKSMDALSVDFEKRCGVIETAAAVAQPSLQTEVLEAVDEQGNKTKLVLGDEMKTFIQSFTSSKERLEQLWAEYEQTQRAIMELALSILDDDQAKIKFNSLDEGSDTADPKLDEKRALQQRTAADELYKSALNDLDGLKKTLDELVVEKLNKNNQLLSDFKKQTAQIQKTMLGLLNDIQG